MIEKEGFVRWSVSSEPCKDMYWELAHPGANRKISINELKINVKHGEIVPDAVLALYNSSGGLTIPTDFPTLIYVAEKLSS